MTRGTRILLLITLAANITTVVLNLSLTVPSPQAGSKGRVEMPATPATGELGPVRPLGNMEDYTI